MKKKPATPTPAEPELTAATAKKALAFDLRNLLVKVKSGKPLTRYERQLVEEKLHAPGGAAAPAATFAANQSELARVLGVSRQLVAFHAKKPDSPARREDGRYEVRAWREYLAVNGRVDVNEGETSPGRASASYSDIADFAAQRGLERACTVLPLVVGEALEGRLPQEEIAKLVAETWCALATRLTGYITADGPRSVPLETPPQILAMCAAAAVPCPTGIDIGEDTED
jgi:hypothetical protein